MAPVARLRAVLCDVIDRQRGGLFPWVPVCLGIGIGCYFALLSEPAPWLWAVLGALAVGLTLWVMRLGIMALPLLMALLLMLCGFLLAGTRAHLVAEPVLGFRYYGPVEGRIIRIDRSVSDRVRLTLDQVVLSDMRPTRLPWRLRVSLGDSPGTPPVVGKRVGLTAHLSPPAGPVEAGGFDFQRMAWFQGLGAVGYSQTPLIALGAMPGGFSLARWRDAISAEVRARLPGEAGAFAAAVITGDRSAMSRDALTALRQSNLAHLLAISGLHMGLLTTFVFGVLRLILVALPGVALGWPVKKIAAVGALCVGAVYLALSGGNVATQRAFIMVAVMFGAILLDRRALTLRAVAVAAIIVLLLRPESLTQPGFQMSFSATIALVAVFRALRDFNSDRVPRWAAPVVATVLSSAVAGAATAPIAAAHFNMIAHYGLLANLMSVPLMGLVVMPGAVVAACLAPFGLHGVGLALMEPAIRWIMGVAHWTAAQDGAVGRVITPGPWVIPLFALGMLWLALWQGRARLFGLVPSVLAFVLWGMAERPALLVSESGGLIGVMTKEGRTLNKPRGEGFVALSWLENDGDHPDQERAAGRAGLRRVGAMVVFDLAGVSAVHLSGRGAKTRIAQGCAAASLVFLAAETEETAPDGCRLYDRKVLRRAGGLSVFTTPEGLRFVGARPAAGARLWNTR